MKTKTRSYKRMLQLPTFEERYEYLKLGGKVSEATFGSKRYLNQLLYRQAEWKKVRRDVIIRDNGCDLAFTDRPIGSELIYVHHINPITIDDILERDPIVFDLDNLVCTTFNTHNAIHYGDKSLLLGDPVERKPFDTCPWR